MSETVKELTPKVPELRFPGFDGEIPAKMLKDITSMMQSGLSRLLKEADIGLPVIRSNNILGGQLELTDIKYWYKDDPQGANTASYFLEDGDLLVNFINSIAQIGKFALYKNTLNRPVILTTNVLRLKFTPNIIPEYAFYFFHHQSYKNYIYSITKPAVNQASFTTKDFGRLQVFLPTSEEQSKIADFLTAVDERIQGLAKKKELLEYYKKGVMQKLFSQKIRFTQDDGTAFPDWKEKQLGTISAKPGNRNVDETVVEVLTNSATQGVISQQDYFDKDIAVQGNLSNYHVVEVNDFVYNPRISSSAPVGPLNRNQKHRGVMSPLYTILRFNNGNLDYLEYYFKTSCWHRYMHSIANIGARHDRMNVTAVDFAKMPIPLPHPKEQKKIAGFLLLIDDKIISVSKQLNMAEAFKKGLLQKMFV